MPKAPESNTLAQIRSQSDPLRSPVEAAEYLGLKPHTLAVWRTTGRYSLPYVRIGGLVRYRQSALDAFIAARTRAGTE